MPRVPTLFPRRAAVTAICGLRIRSVLIDAARLAAAVGADHWLDPKHWHSSKLPVAPHLSVVLADVIARTIAALRGKTRKCLVLDLDNTIWGGVIDDDGLDGISLGQGSAEGEAFLSVQRAALELRTRGVARRLRAGFHTTA